MNMNRRLLIAALFNDHPACSVIDLLAAKIKETTKREYVWRGKAACQFGRVEPAHDNGCPVLLKGIEGLHFNSFEGTEGCVSGEGIIIATRGSSAMSAIMDPFPVSSFFGCWRLSGDAQISGMNKLILLNGPGKRTEQLRLETIGQAVTAIMTCLEQPAVESAVFKAPKIEGRKSRLNLPPLGA
jgi:hypothetical protein